MAGNVERKQIDFKLDSHPRRIIHSHIYEIQTRRSQKSERAMPTSHRGKVKMWIWRTFYFFFLSLLDFFFRFVLFELWNGSADGFFLSSRLFSGGFGVIFLVDLRVKIEMMMTNRCSPPPNVFSSVPELSHLDWKFWFTSTWFAHISLIIWSGSHGEGSHKRRRREEEKSTKLKMKSKSERLRRCREKLSIFLFNLNKLAIQRETRSKNIIFISLCVERLDSHSLSTLLS